MIAIVLVAFAIVHAVLTFVDIRARKTSRYPPIPDSLRFTPEEQAAVAAIMKSGAPIEDEATARKLIGQWETIGGRLPRDCRDPNPRSKAATYVVLPIILGVALAGGLTLVALFAVLMLVTMSTIDAHRLWVLRRLRRWVEATQAVHQQPRT